MQSRIGTLDSEGSIPSASIKQFKTYYSSPSTGSFGTESYSGWVEFTTCRESFQYASLARGMFYVHSKKKQNNVISFLKEIERRLKLNKLSEIQTTNHSNVIYIKLASFWRDSPIRRSFLTMSLRCGSAYNGNNFWECYSRTVRTRAALTATKAFFDGYTRMKIEPVSSRNGWFRLLSNKTEKEVKSLMKHE